MEKEMSENTVPLTQAPRILRENHRRETTYRKLYGLVLDGKIPAHKDAEGRLWLIYVDDLPKIAETLKPFSVEDLAPPGWDGKIIA
jgi:hypothetical protein